MCLCRFIDFQPMSYVTALLFRICICWSVERMSYQTVLHFQEYLIFLVSLPQPPSHTLYLVGSFLSTWWRHQMETFLLAICAGNSPVPGEFPTQRPVTRSFDVFFGLRLNKRLSKQPWGWWFETPLGPLWRHRNDNVCRSYSINTLRPWTTWPIFWNPHFRIHFLNFGLFLTNITEV